jgi:PAS domain S-box-containing protein
MSKPVRTVLIVDENPAAAVTYQQYLEHNSHWHYECVQARTGAQALELCQTVHPACVLLAATLPDLSGLEVLAALAQQTTATAMPPGALEYPVVLLTAVDDADLALAALQAGAQEIINQTHLTPFELQHTINQAIERLAWPQQLLASELRFRQFAEQIHQVVWFCELNPERIVYVSPAFENIWGIAAETLYQEPRFWMEAVHPDDRQPVREAFEAWAAGRAKTYDIEYRIRRPDQSERWIHDRGVAVRDAQGLPVSVSGIADDITARKRGEAQLSASEERFRTLTEALPQLVWTCQPDGNCDYLSHRWLEYTGTTVAENLNFGWLDVVHPDDVSQTQTGWALATQAAATYEAEFRLRRADGQYRWHLTRAIPLRDEQGQVVKWVGTNTDIEELKRAEVERQRLAAVVESSDDAIYTKTLAGVVTSWNDSATRLFGFSAEQMLDQSVAVLIPPELQNEETTLIEKILRGERVRHFETVRLNRAGARLDLSLSLSPILDEQGRVVSISTIARDITAQRLAANEREQMLKRQERALELAEDANRLKDEFLTTVSHELRTPLNHMYGWVKMLRTGVLNEEDQARALETIERNLKAQHRLIEDLLDVSRIITGKMRLDVRPVPLSSIIQATLESVRPTAEAKGVRLQVILDPRSHTISGDPDRLQQVVWNLLSNAIKFTPKGGRVQLRLERVNSNVQIIISDTGAGIDPEFLPFVFERFRQQDGSRARLHGGLGLGLAIVRHLVELHGGSVSVTSPGIGQGATFCVELPLAVTHSLRRQPEARHPADGAGLALEQLPSLDRVKVLLVDDEPDSLLLLKALLLPAGAEIRLANDTQSALDVLQVWQPDVLVSDIGMPANDGYELIRIIRQRNPADAPWLPAIALTGYASTEDRIWALSAGFQMHIAKPVEPAELITVIASLAGRIGAA